MYKKFKLIFILFLLNFIPCFPQEKNGVEEIEEKPRHDIMIATGFNFFGSFFQKRSLGLGFNLFISEHPSSVYSNDFILNNGITFEYVQSGIDFFNNNGTMGDFYKTIAKSMDIASPENRGFQLRVFTHITYLLLCEIGISGSIYVKGNKDILYGVAPELAFGIPPLHFFPISPALLYRYNIYNFNINSLENYHEISLSLKALLPFGID
jgi:hypothetical protein